VVSAKKPPPRTPRAQRRADARSAEKLARSRERLAHLEPGGDPARPLVVESASQVEPSALALTCLRCSGPNRLVEHAAVTVDDQRLRVARLACPQCGARRDVWFRLDRALPN
jgi:hypothetical protein